MEVVNSGWFGAILGLLGIAFGLWTYIAAKRDPAPTYIARHRSVFEVGDSGLLQQFVELRYRGVEVERLTVSTVTLWNRGKGVLMGSALVDADPLRLSVPEDCRIMEAQVTRETTPASQCRIGLRSDRDLHLSFDYLNPGDGFCVRVVHTAPAYSPRRRLHLHGSLRGARIESPLPSPHINRVYALLSRLPRTSAILILITLPTLPFLALTTPSAKGAVLWFQQAAMQGPWSLRAAVWAATVAVISFAWVAFWKLPPPDEAVPFSLRDSDATRATPADLGHEWTGGGGGWSKGVVSRVGAPQQPL